MKAKVVRMGDRRQVDSRSTGSLDCFVSKWADSISAFPTDSQTRPPPAPIRGIIIIIIIIIIILLKQDYKVQLANNKIQMAWLTCWIVVG